MSDDNVKVEIERLSEQPVVAFWGVDKPFKLIGRGFSERKIEVYISKNEYGNGVVEQIKVDIDPGSADADGFLSVIAHAELGTDREPDYWVAVKLNGEFQSAKGIFKVF
ncbi:hypothetical protein [Rhizobium sp. WYJ-E13]|uniref:hypothetical protein n=1 Tax=Rhizobium sp. WYJ-E13 TaxID=2849093 RepID=UPI001C1EF944|nr:hypothetical protein [Rhizobium sp. WYJ-E13]QWW71699.1 hypothetical protein KQ933_24065 [Rhizobium sp. WYJ-E13]